MKLLTSDVLSFLKPSNSVWVRSSSITKRFEIGDIIREYLFSFGLLSFLLASFGYLHQTLIGQLIIMENDPTKRPSSVATQSSSERKSVAASSNVNSNNSLNNTKILISPELKQLLELRQKAKATLISFSVVQNSTGSSNNTSLYDSRDDIPLSSLGPLQEWTDIIEKLSNLTHKLELQHQSATSTVTTLMGSVKEGNNNSNTGIPVNHQYNQFSSETQNLYNECTLSLYYLALSTYMKAFKSSPLVGRGLNSEGFYNQINSALTTIEVNTRTTRFSLYYNRLYYG